MNKIKTYRPIHVNVESDLLARLDQYKAFDKPRSRLIHEAIEQYLVTLEQSNARKKQWLV